jgi:hypothetical protein
VSGRVASVSVEIRMEHLPNTSLERYLYLNPLDEFMRFSNMNLPPVLAVLYIYPHPKIICKVKVKLSVKVRGGP